MDFQNKVCHGHDCIVRMVMNLDSAAKKCFSIPILLNSLHPTNFNLKVIKNVQTRSKDEDRNVTLRLTHKGTG
jgi:hypothetical protein